MRLPWMAPGLPPRPPGKCAPARSLAADDVRDHFSKSQQLEHIACVPKIILGLASGEITRERSDPAAWAKNVRFAILRR